MLLAGDIGGTKTSLGLYLPDKGPHEPLAEATFPSANYDSLEALSHDFLKDHDVDIQQASFGVAGPVINGEADITNLSWKMREDTLADALKVEKVSLLNDLEAIASGVLSLPEKDLYCLNAGTSSPKGTIAVIAPGTGLGEAFLSWNQGHYSPQASEGGHCDFAPTSELELDLLRYLKKHFGHVSYERVCSGTGLPNIYNFLKDEGYYSEPEWLGTEISKAKDPTPIIVTSGLEKTSEICIKTLDLFLSILASEAGNLTLKLMATGGVYIGGGIPPRLLSAFDNESFMNVFSDKGRLSNVLQQVPVNIILNPKVALVGAACYGLSQL